MLFGRRRGNPKNLKVPISPVKKNISYEDEEMGILKPMRPGAEANTEPEKV